MKKYFPGDSEMAQLMREHDWTATPLGPVNNWPQSLRSALTICLRSASPILICWGNDYTLLYNDASKAMMGDKHPEALGDSASRVFSKIWGIIGTRIGHVFSTGKASGVDNQRIELIRDGSSEERYFNFMFNPISNEDGTVDGIFTIAFETTGHYRVEQRLRESERLFRAIVESATEFAIFTIDFNGRINSWNTGAERLLGWKDKEAIGQFVAIIYRDDDDNGSEIAEREIQLAREKGSALDERWHVRKDGSRFWASGMMMSLTDDAGNLIGYVKILQDHTERKQAQETQRILLEELNHRINNMIATIRGIASQTLKETTNPSDFVDNFNGRLNSLAHAHSLLTNSSWEGAYVGKILHKQLALQGIIDRISYSGPHAFLSSKTTLHLALVLYELGTNARKYGALSNTKGRVNVNWEIIQNKNESEVKLNWLEKGGPRVEIPNKSGFGRTLIEQSLRSVGGKADLHFEPSGVRCEITLPLLHKNRAMASEQLNDDLG
ncbi:MAG: PAS domain S-box protein [Balneolales bacterium]